MKPINDVREGEFKTCVCITYPPKLIPGNYTMYYPSEVFNFRNRLIERANHELRMDRNKPFAYIIHFGMRDC